MILHYQSRFGLARGAVYYKDKPHLYAEGYEYDPSAGVLGTRSVARLRAKSGGMAFLKLFDGTDAVLDASQEIADKLTEGAAVEIEIVAERRDDGQKLARGKFIALADGEPRRLSQLFSLKERLLKRACLYFGDLPIALDDDDEALDAAESEARDPSGDLPGGGYLSVEATRALIACDVDSAGAGENKPPRAVAKACNDRALTDLPRRLRLSGLAGLVVIDLIGRRFDAAQARTLLQDAFGAEFSHIQVGAAGKFGTLEFVRPWGACPLRASLHPVHGALYLLRQAIAMSAQDRGRVLVVRGRPEVIDVLRPLIANSLDPLAPMLRLETAPRNEVIAL